MKLARWTKVLFVIGMVIVLALSVYSAAPKKKQLVFGFTQPSTEEWFTRNYNGFKAYCDANGIKVLYMQTQKSQDALEQVNHVEQMIAKKVDAIAISVIDSKLQVVSAEAARKAGIPVGTNGATLDIPKFSEYDVDVKVIGDNYLPAKTLGLFIAKELGGKGNVVILKGIPGMSIAEDRDRGINEGCKQGGLKVLDDQPCNFDAQKAYDVMSDFLMKYPKIDAVFGAHDDGVLACYEAAKAVGREKQIRFYGFDGSASVRQAIAKGTIQGTIDMNSYNMGWLLASGLHHAATYKSYQRNIIEVEYLVLNSKNIYTLYPELKKK